MTVTSQSPACPWLLLVFSLPAKRASERVEIWRKLQRYGTLPLRSSGYVLPNSAVNRERMEWLATAIRGYKGQASVVQAQVFDDLPGERLKQRFSRPELLTIKNYCTKPKKIVGLPPSRRPAGSLNRLRRRFLELQDIDFFGSPLRVRVESLLNRADQAKPTRGRKRKAGEYLNRVWITRPRPGN